MNVASIPICIGGPTYRVGVSALRAQDCELTTKFKTRPPGTLDEFVGALEAEVDQFWLEGSDNIHVAMARSAERTSQLDNAWGAPNPAWELLTAYEWPRQVGSGSRVQTKAACVLVLPRRAGTAAAVADTLKDATALVHDWAERMAERIRDLTNTRAGAVWDELSHGIRMLTELKHQRQIRAAALTLHGRGRVTGPVRVDQLIRFGVSEWR